MKKLAIIVTESFSSLRGQANAELSRIKALRKISNMQIDVYSFAIYEGWLVRKLRHTAKEETPLSKIVEDVKISFKWRKFSLIDYVLTVKLNKAPIVNRNWMLKYVDMFAGYDLIMSHSADCGELLMAIRDKYKIPFYVTWHGSDIHTWPFSSRYAWSYTKKILDNAEINFMVSKALLETANKISTKENKMVLYNGYDDTKFVRYEDSKRVLLKQKYHVVGKKVVAFAGNLLAIKNPMSLPEIFNNVYKNYCGDVKFWILGSGKYQEPLRKRFADYKLPVEFCGNVSNEEMPDRYNCIDVLVLPSLNEGLPLVTVEALACGANAVGSCVGGIPEVLGEENVFSLGDMFTYNIADRIVYLLNNRIEQKLKPCFSWERTAELESKIYHQNIQ